MKTRLFQLSCFEHPYLDMAAGQSPWAVLAKIALMKFPFGQCEFF